MDWVIGFQDEGRKPQFSVNMWTLEAQIGASWIKIKSFLHTHTVSIYTKFKEDSVISFPDTDLKPQFSVISGQPSSSWAICLP